MHLPEPMDVVGYVRRLEELLIITSTDSGSPGSGFPVVAESGCAHARAKDRRDRRARRQRCHDARLRLNVDCDLSAYDRIVPCGIRDAEVTSLHHETGKRRFGGRGGCTSQRAGRDPASPGGAGVRIFGILLAALVWISCWLIAPASWWLNETILDEQAFAASMQEVLQIEDVDTQITNRATAQVMADARAFVDRTVPLFAAQADALLDRAEPTVQGLVNQAVNSQPGERVMLGLAAEVHNTFLAWLDEDTFGRPGLQADLSQGRAVLDVDELLAGQSVNVGPLVIPLDALDLPGLQVPVPLPPDWMRLPVNLLRSAFVPAVVGIVVAGAALLCLRSRPDPRTGRRRGRHRHHVRNRSRGAPVIVDLTGADSAQWTITRAIGELMVRPWITAYLYVIGAMLLITIGGLVWGPSPSGRRPASARRLATWRLPRLTAANCCVWRCATPRPRSSANRRGSRPVRSWARSTTNCARQLRTAACTPCARSRMPQHLRMLGGQEATFLIGGDQCTRRCDFCQIDTGRPQPLTPANR